MKNITRLIWLIALVAVIAFGLAACKDDDDGNETTSTPSTNGRLTISGLSAHDGKYVFVSGNTIESLREIHGMQSGSQTMNAITGYSSFTYVLPQIANGSVTVNLWEKAGSWTAFTRSWTYTITVRVYNTQSISSLNNPTSTYTGNITFSNGVGSGSVQ